MKNTNKIVMNQYLTPPVFSRIESRLILSVLLLGLFILTACGAGAAIEVASGTQGSLGQNSNSSGSSGNGQLPDSGSGQRQPEPNYDPKVDADDWLRSFATPVPRLPDETNPRNQFVTEISTLDPGDRLDADITVYTTDRTFDYMDLDANSSGYAEFGSIPINGILYYYAGTPSRAKIFPARCCGSERLLTSYSTGLPIPAYETENPVSADWNGRFDPLSGIATDFVLTVNFRDSTVEAFVQLEYYSLKTNDYYHIKGNYANNAEKNSDGVITGTVNFGTFSDIDARTPTNNRPANGVLSGLIGQDGAIGVFVSGTTSDGGVTINGGTGDDGFAGGFWATPTTQYSPNVTYGDWVRADRLTDLSLFNIGYNDGSGLTANSDGTGDRSTITSLNLRDAIVTRYPATLGGDVNNSVSLVYGFDNGSPRNLGALTHHVWIGTGADLGAPLPRTRTTATWEGSIIGVFPSAVGCGGDCAFKQNFYLDIDFFARRISSQVTRRSNVRGANVRDLFYFDLNGSYDDNGVISGGATSGTARNVFNLQTFSSQVVLDTDYHGSLTGIIGEDGAVGIFASNNRSGDRSYVGGFVACPLLQNDRCESTFR